MGFLFQYNYPLQVGKIPKAFAYDPFVPNLALRQEVGREIDNLFAKTRTSRPWTGQKTCKNDNFFSQENVKGWQPTSEYDKFVYRGPE
jgi:hypothetical protein